MYYGREQRHPPSVLGAHGFAAEIAGRDRTRYFRRPVEARGIAPSYTDIESVRFASSMPGTPQLTGHFLAAPIPDRTASSGGRGVVRPHHLPSMYRRGGGSKKRSATAVTASATAGNSRGVCDVGIQTAYRENEAQTLPYTPEYFIPEGGDPNPEVLGLRHLHWNDGLPAGTEEVELIQRLRRRRALEASLPPANDATSAETRFRMLYALEEKEREERESHMAKIRERRLDEIRDALTERERAREESNRSRLEAVKKKKLDELRNMIERSEMKRIVTDQKSLEEGTSKTMSSENRNMYAVDPISKDRRKVDLIDSYSKYGTSACPLKIGPRDASKTTAPLQPAEHFRHYDVRPTMLTVSEGIQELEKTKIPRIQKLPSNAFKAPERGAISSLPTLYQRREATRVVDGLEYIHQKIQKTDMPGESFRVLELYRATPRLQRPDTPELELEGDTEEELEEACILLQRLVRGRAVQNDFFDGKERCRGLIEELQAASNAKYAERSLEEKQQEEVARRREAIAESIGDTAQGDIIVETLDYLFHELTRQQDLRELEELHRNAEAVRAEREAKEAELRAQERLLHDKEALQYAAYTRVIDDVVECYSHQLYATAAEECAMEEAINAECVRVEQISAPPIYVDSIDESENIVCDMLDSFVLPAVVDMVCNKANEWDRKAPTALAVEIQSTMAQSNNKTGGEPPFKED